MEEDEKRIHELEQWKRKREIEIGIRDGISKKVRAVCVTAASAILGMFYTLGNIAYNKSEAIGAAIKAFILVDRGGQ